MRKLVILLAVSAIFVLSSRAQGLERLTLDELQDNNVKKQAIVHTTKGDLYFDIVNDLYYVNDRGKFAWESYLIAMQDGRFSNRPVDVGEELVQVSYPANEGQYAIEVPTCLGSHSVCPGDIVPGGAIIQVPGGQRSGVSRCRIMFARIYREVTHYELAVYMDGFKEHNAQVVQSLVNGDSVREIEIGRAQTQTPNVSSSNATSGSSNNDYNGMDNGNFASNFIVAGQPFNLSHKGDIAFEISLYDLLMQDGIFRRDSLHESFDERKMSQCWTESGYRERFGEFMAVQLAGSKQDDNLRTLNIGSLGLDVNGRKIPPYTPNSIVSGGLYGPRFWRVLWNFLNPGASTSLSIGRSERTFYVPYLLSAESRGSNGRYMSEGLGSFSDGLGPYEIGVLDAIGRIYDINGRFIETRPIPEIDAARRRVTIR